MKKITTLCDSCKTKEILHEEKIFLIIGQISNGNEMVKDIRHVEMCEMCLTDAVNTYFGTFGTNEDAQRFLKICKYDRSNLKT